jgi:hypothetical protein
MVKQFGLFTVDHVLKLFWLVIFITGKKTTTNHTHKNQYKQSNRHLYI